MSKPRTTKTMPKQKPPSSELGPGSFSSTNQPHTRVSSPEKVHRVRTQRVHREDTLHLSARQAHIVNDGPLAQAGTKKRPPPSDLPGPPAKRQFVHTTHGSGVSFKVEPELIAMREIPQTDAGRNSRRRTQDVAAMLVEPPRAHPTHKREVQSNRHEGKHRLPDEHAAHSARKQTDGLQAGNHTPMNSYEKRRAEGTRESVKPARSIQRRTEAKVRQDPPEQSRGHGQGQYHEEAHHLYPGTAGNYCLTQRDEGHDVVSHEECGGESETESEGKEEELAEEEVEEDDEEEVPEEDEEEEEEVEEVEEEKEEEEEPERASKTSHATSSRAPFPTDDDGEGSMSIYDGSGQHVSNDEDTPDETTMVDDNYINASKSGGHRSDARVSRIQKSHKSPKSQKKNRVLDSSADNTHLEEEGRTDGMPGSDASEPSPEDIKRETLTDAEADMSIELLQFELNWNDRMAVLTNQLSQRQAAEFTLELKLLNSTLKWQADHPDEIGSVDPFERLRSKLAKMQKATAEFRRSVSSTFSDDKYQATIATLSRAHQSIHQNMMNRSRSRSPSRAGSASVSVLSAPGSPSV